MICHTWIFQPERNKELKIYPQTCTWTSVELTVWMGFPVCQGTEIVTETCSSHQVEGQFLKPPGSLKSKATVSVLEYLAFPCFSKEHFLTGIINL
jgi:hypothetical protein